MKIKKKILLYFTGIIFVSSLIFLAGSGLASFDILKNDIGKYNSIIATENSHSIDRIINRRLERWHSYISSNKDLFQALDSSNKEFEAKKDRNQYIANRDKEWVAQQADSTSPFMLNIIESPLSGGFRDRIGFYNKEYGYDIFPEMIITNKFGVNIAQTGKTSDYNQSDEEWWQKAVKDKFYVGEIEYDESAKTESIPICIRIEDKASNFVGVIKVIYDFKDIFAAISEIKEEDNIDSKNTHENLKSAQIYLIDAKSKLIYSTDANYKTGHDFSYLNGLVINENKNGKNFFVDKRVFNQSSLISAAISEGYEDYSGLGWKIIIVNNTSEVFAPFARLLYILITIFVANLLLSVIIGLYLSRNITLPISQIEEDIRIYSGGNLNHRSQVKSKDEIGKISNAFNQLTASIKESRSEVDKKVVEQTKEIVEKSHDMEDQQKAVLNILEDVEEEKENVEQEKDKIDAILHSIGDGVFVVDDKLRIIVFNSVAAELAGCEINEAMGKKYSDVLHFSFEDSGEVNDEFITKAMETGEIQEMANHTQITKKDGTKVAVADSAAPLQDKQGKVIGCVVVFRDVSKEREVDRAKTEFVSLASHQLRTPLSSVNWFAEMLLAGDAGKLTKEQNNFVQKIYDGNQRMVELVNALLNVSRIELGTFSVEPEPIEIIEISKSVIEELTPQIKEKKLKVSESYDKVPKFNADPKLVRIILQNLLSNAVKYTPEKGEVSVSITLSNRNIFIQVKDSGYGIPKSQQDKIFTKLFRADNVREKETEGTGLGLYIVKSIVDNSGGEIGFDSAENKGTTFHISLPLAGMEAKEGSKRIE